MRQIEVELANGADVAKACRSAGGEGASQLTGAKALEKENHRLKKIVADLELDKLILKESLDFFKAQDLTADDLRGAVIQARQKLGTSERRTCAVLGIRSGAPYAMLRLAGMMFIFAYP